MNDSWDLVAIVVAIDLAALVLCHIVVRAKECESEGGVLIRGALSYECVKLERPKTEAKK